MKKASWGGALFLALTYGTNAVYQGYISKFYQQRGMRGDALAWLLVSFPLISAAALPLWGWIGDRAKDKRRVLRGQIALSALLLPLLARSEDFGWLLALGCGFAACYPAIQPLGDSVILRGLQREGRPFGPVRLAGCLAFAGSSLAAGRLLQNDYAAVPLITCAGLAGAFAASFCLPPDGAPGRKSEKGGLRRVLYLPHMAPLLALYMLLQLTLGFFYSYYAIFFTALPGSGSGLLGISLFLGTISEAPFLMLGDRLFRRFGAGRLLLLAAGALTLRFLLLGLSHSLALVMASQLLHGLSFAVITFSMAKYISQTAPAELRAGGQMILASAGYGLARTCGSLLGGMLTGYIDLQACFLLMAGAAFGGFFGFARLFLRLPPLNGKA